MFKAGEFVSLCEAPAFEDLQGRTHVERLLSHREMLVHYAKLLEAYGQVEANPARVGEAMLDAAKKMFDADAVEALLDLPAPVLEAAFNDFFQSHRRTKAPT